MKQAIVNKIFNEVSRKERGVIQKIGNTMVGSAQHQILKGINLDLDLKITQLEKRVPVENRKMARGAAPSRTLVIPEKIKIVAQN